MDLAKKNLSLGVVLICAGLILLLIDVSFISKWENPQKYTDPEYSITAGVWTATFCLLVFGVAYLLGFSIVRCQDKK
jgi:hypothetical protein